MTASNIELALVEHTTTCCIHFSSRNKPLGKYDRYPVPANVSNIYVNTGDRSWYLDGLTSLGASLDDAIGYFEALISDKRYSKVVCIGSSMGAFGAALFAARLDAECICFGPELCINVYSGFSEKDAVSGNADFSSLQPARALLVAGIACQSDTLTSLYYANKWANTEAVIIENCGHESARFLKDNGHLRSLIDDFIQGSDPSAFESIPTGTLTASIDVLPPEQLGRLQIENFYELTKIHVSTFQKLRLAEQLTNKRIFSLAEKILSEYLAEHGPLAEAIFLQAKLFRRMRRDDAALSAFKQLEQNPEYRLQGLWGQSMIHSKLGNETESQRLYQQIITTSTAAPIVKESLRLYAASKESQLVRAPEKNLVLTTFPGHKSKNVGDSMIARSATELLSARNPGFKAFTLFREQSLDNYQDGSIKRIIAPGFSVSNGAYPALYQLYSNLDRMPEFHPIGCSFQHSIASRKSFEEYTYNQNSVDFLNFIAKRVGAIPCRDQLIVELLQRHDIPAIYSGDLVLFDKDHLHTLFTPPNLVDTVAFSIQHHPKYDEQSFSILSLICNIFPTAKKIVTFHSKPSPSSSRIANFATVLGFEERHLYGDSENLDAYDDIDLHVGYRLHGHISFLRRRKPSILLVEDARSYGFSRTSGTSIGCFDALNEETEQPSQTVTDEVRVYINGQLTTQFEDYPPMFDFIDKTYDEFVGPFFDNLASKC
tara:strand:+ start:7304 stop:9442 length:2139 start_codon:yes stop_codon:yes gene_type:complete